MLLAAVPAAAQTRRVRQTREEYIDRYKSIAVADMERVGIPASITTVCYTQLRAHET